jgi:RNA polymerase sigma-70 factor (ECF subfamily)
LDPTLTRTEAQLIAAAQHNLGAFDALYVLYAERVFRFLYSRVGLRAEAEDLTAQTFLAAMEAFPRYRHRGHFAAWLFSIARNKTNDHFRRGKPHAELDEIAEMAGEYDLFAEVISREQRDALRSQLSQLREDEREILQLRYVAELSFAEISSLLGRSEDAVKKSLYRSIERLQSRLEVAR